MENRKKNLNFFKVKLTPDSNPTEPADVDIFFSNNEEQEVFIKEEILTQDQFSNPMIDPMLPPMPLNIQSNNQNNEPPQFEFKRPTKKRKESVDIEKIEETIKELSNKQRSPEENRELTNLRGSLSYYKKKARTENLIEQVAVLTEQNNELKTKANAYHVERNQLLNIIAGHESREKAYQKYIQKLENEGASLHTRHEDLKEQVIEHFLSTQKTPLDSPKNTSQLPTPSKQLTFPQNTNLRDNFFQQPKRGTTTVFFQDNSNKNNFNP